MPETILITGASSDLGLALARRLLMGTRPAVVIAHAHRGASRIEDLQREFGERVYPITADFSDANSVKVMAAQIGATFGAPNQLVCLPALRPTPERLTKFNLERFREDMAIQVEAPFILLQHFAPLMTKAPMARVVFVSSSYTHGMPPKFVSMYTVVKYAQLGLMRAAAAEYASTQLTVNSVAPGMIETKFLADIPEAVIKMNAGANPKGRNAHPDDVVGAIEFLLSQDAGFITGVDIPITAGTNC